MDSPYLHYWINWGYDLLTSCDFRDEESLIYSPSLQVGTALGRGHSESLRSKRAGRCWLFNPSKDVCQSVGIPLAQRYHLWDIYTEETAKCIACIFSISYLFPIVPYRADLRYATKRTFVCLMDMTRSTSHMFPAICLFAGFILQYQVYPLSLIYYSLF